jgi:Flp pilus assembly protein TadG
MSICIHAQNTLLRLSRRLRQERGVVLVEFAIVLPVLILIILGILYFGRYENYANQETQLAETGVRFAALSYLPSGSGCSANLQAYIKCQATSELQSGSSDVTSPLQVYIYQPSGATGYSTGQPVRVCVLSTVVFPSPIGTPSATIAESATMRIEQVGSGTTFPYTSTNPTTAVPSQCPS